MSVAVKTQVGAYNFEPEVGAVPFPGYRITRLRGRGAFASVWESTSPNGSTLAMKFMSSGTSSITAREIRSLRAIQTVDHPNLLKIRQVWSLPGCIVIGMDLAEASLLDLLEVYLEEYGKALDAKQLGMYFFHVADALDYLNARKHRVSGQIVGLQHGDIKPNNILLVDDQARLADYGLATPTASAMTPCPRHGTVEYCAPEVFQGNLSERSDQFSLAVTYFVMRTGTFPYPQPPVEREKLAGYVRPKPELSLLTAAERPVLARALSPIPQNRFPNCKEMVKSLLLANGLHVERTEEGAHLLKCVMPDTSSAPKSQLFK
ncbi:MAG: protein kinase domain-containing protein [Fimbriiglobus sp.]